MKLLLFIKFRDLENFYLSFLIFHYYVFFLSFLQSHFFVDFSILNFHFLSIPSRETEIYLNALGEIYVIDKHLPRLNRPIVF